MRLSDIMSQMGLASYAELGLVIFLIVFIAVGVRTFFVTHPSEHLRAAQLPLQDDIHPLQPKGRLE